LKQLAEGFTANGEVKTQAESGPKAYCLSLLAHMAAPTPHGARRSCATCGKDRSHSLLLAL
jgi:hypothetical protein